MQLCVTHYPHICITRTDGTTVQRGLETIVFVTNSVCIKEEVLEFMMMIGN